MVIRRALLLFLALFLAGCGSGKVVGRIGNKTKMGWTYMLVKSDVLDSQSGKILDMKTLIDMHSSATAAFKKNDKPAHENRMDATVKILRRILKEDVNVAGASLCGDDRQIKFEQIPYGAYILVAVPDKEDQLPRYEFCQSVDHGRGKTDLGNVYSQ